MVYSLADVASSVAVVTEPDDEYDVDVDMRVNELRLNDLVSVVASDKSDISRSGTASMS